MSKCKELKRVYYLKNKDRIKHYRDRYNKLNEEKRKVYVENNKHLVKTYQSKYFSKNKVSYLIMARFEYLYQKDINKFKYSLYSLFNKCYKYI